MLELSVHKGRCTQYWTSRVELRLSSCNYAIVAITMTGLVVIVRGPAAELLLWLQPHARIRASTISNVGLNSASYLADERWLCSTESRTCVVTWTHSAFGDRAFAAAGPGLWNSLPPHLRDADLPYSRFRRSLKTFLFGHWGHGAVWTFLTAPSRNSLTYLLTYSVLQHVGWNQ